MVLHRNLDLVMTERQNHSEIENQEYRETERQDTERQKYRDRETGHSETETQRDRNKNWKMANITAAISNFMKLACKERGLQVVS